MAGIENFLFWTCETRFFVFLSPPLLSLCHSLFSGYIIYMHYTLAGREEKKLLNQGLVNIYLCEKGENLCKPRPPFFCPGKDHKLFFSLDFFEFRKKNFRLFLSCSKSTSNSIFSQFFHPLDRFFWFLFSSFLNSQGQKVFFLVKFSRLLSLLYTKECV